MNLVHMVSYGLVTLLHTWLNDEEENQMCLMIFWWTRQQQQVRWLETWLADFTMKLVFHMEGVKIQMKTLQEVQSEIRFKERKKEELISQLGNIESELLKLYELEDQMFEVEVI